MLIVTTDTIAGYEIRFVRGAVSGTGLQSSGAMGLSDARRSAIERLKADAERHHCNAVIGMRFENTNLGNGGFEVCAYGTAVTVEQVAAPVAGQFQSGAVPPAPPAGPSSGGIPMVGRNMTVQVPNR
ncbi:YbjQ family protein [Actinocorallia lasiicapitis]